ncbi:MAG: BatD family protein [Phycisphaerales bacterium]|nr:BatD family protein [Phycisphaerales bacterium]
MITQLRFMLACLLIGGLSSTTIAADEVLLEAELSRARAYIGDEISYQVLVRGSHDGARPSVNFPDSVIAEYRGASSQQFTTMRSINGRQRTVTDAYYKHQYLLRVVKEGEIVIPPASLQQDGKRFTSNQVSVTALFPARAQDDRIEIDLPDRDIYVGESIRARVSWWVADQTQGLSFDTSLFPESFKVSAATPEQHSGDPQVLEIFGNRIQGYVDNAIYQGQPMARLQFDMVITPTQSGAFEFGPVRVVFTRQDDFSRAARMYAESETHQLSVITVPSEGKPSGYQGLIGSFQVLSDASNTKVNVGDPIEFRVLVSGPEPMIGLEPTLESQSLSSNGFRVSPDGWKEVKRTRTSERLFSTTIRATDDSVTEIPAIRLPSFNPETGEFEVFSSSAIPLEVRSVRTVTLRDAVINPTDTDAPVATNDERIELAENPSALWSHPSAQKIRSSPRAFSLKAVSTDPVWITTGLCIAGLPIASLLYVRRSKSHDPRAAEIQRAWKRAKKLHAMGDSVGAIRVYGGAVLDIEPESLTGADLEQLAISKEIVQRSAAILTESESVHYGSLPEARSDTSLLHAMRRDLKSHSATNHRRRTHR